MRSFKSLTNEQWIEAPQRLGRNIHMIKQISLQNIHIGESIKFSHAVRLFCIIQLHFYIHWGILYLDHQIFTILFLEFASGFFVLSDLIISRFKYWWIFSFKFSFHVNLINSCSENSLDFHFSYPLNFFFYNKLLGIFEFVISIFPPQCSYSFFIEVRLI